MRQLFGEAYDNIINEVPKTDYKIASKALERMFAALYTGDITRITVSEFFEQLLCGEKEKKALRKKLRGIDYEKDCAALSAIGGFSRNDAKDYAYLFADAVVWSQLMSVCQLAGMPLTDDTINSIIRGINAAISVEETTKLRLERTGEDGGC